MYKISGKTCSMTECEQDAIRIPDPLWDSDKMARSRKQIGRCGVSRSNWIYRGSIYRPMPLARPIAQIIGSAQSRFAHMGGSPRPRSQSWSQSWSMLSRVHTSTKQASGRCCLPIGRGSRIRGIDLLSVPSARGLYNYAIMRTDLPLMRWFIYRRD
jgi:hypothetical protein